MVSVVGGIHHGDGIIIPDIRTVPSEEAVDAMQVACERIVRVVPLLVDGLAHALVEPVLAREHMVDDGLRLLPESPQPCEALLPVAEHGVVEDDALAVFLEVEAGRPRLPVQDEDVLAVVELLVRRLCGVRVVEVRRLDVARKHVDGISEPVAYREYLEQLRGERVEQHVVVRVIREESLEHVEPLPAVPGVPLGVALESD